MASTRDVAGSGYHNKYIDSLIWGGDVWDTESGPITYFFGGEAALYSTQNIHEGTLFLGYWNLLNDWSQTEKQAFKSAMNVYAGVCNVTFREADDATAANIMWF